MVFNADYQGGKTTSQLLQQYGVQVIVMPGFDFKGHVFFLAAALADPVQKDWKLVYQDNKDVIYMRQPPPGVQPLPSLDALGSLEQQCSYYTAHGLDVACAQSLGDMFARIGDWKRARAWLMNYLAVNPQDPKSRNLLRQLNAAGR